MVMVMFSALVRSHQSTSRVASAPCLARRKTTLTQQSIELLKQRPLLVAGRLQRAGASRAHVLDAIGYRGLLTAQRQRARSVGRKRRLEWKGGWV